MENAPTSRPRAPSSLSTGHSNHQLVFGFHVVEARLRHDAASIEMVWFAQDRHDNRMTRLLQQLQSQGVRMEGVPYSHLQSLVGTPKHQGIVAQVVAQKADAAWRLEDWLASLNEDDKVLLLLLDQIEDPGNFGAVLRVADAAGCGAVVTTHDRSAPLSAHARKASAGAAEVVPLIRVVNLAQAMRLLQKNGFWLVGAEGAADHSLFQARFSSQRLALVVGHEGSGMRRLTKEHCDELLGIPLFGSVESLNVSTAAAIMLYEVRRQWQQEAKAKN